MNFMKLTVAAGLIVQTIGASHAAQTQTAKRASQHANVLTARLRLIEAPLLVEAGVVTTR